MGNRGGRTGPALPLEDNFGHHPDLQEWKITINLERNMLSGDLNFALIALVTWAGASSEE